jgi:hypothetical protein
VIDEPRERLGLIRAAAFELQAALRLRRDVRRVAENEVVVRGGLLDGLGCDAG